MEVTKNNFRLKSLNLDQTDLDLLSNIQDKGNLSEKHGWSKIPTSVYKQIILHAKNTVELKNISQNYSAEGGFSLPLDYELRSKLEAIYGKIHQPARDLRFRNNCLYPKDVPCWSDSEINALADCFEICGIKSEIVYHK